MKHSLVAALSALLLCSAAVWADETAPATMQITGTITDIASGVKVITVTPGGSKGLGIQDQGQVPPKKGGDVPPPKKGGDIIPPPKGGGDQIPLKGGETPIQSQDQTPPPKKGGDIIPPPKGGETPIQDQGQVPPPKKGGSKDLGDPSQDQSQGQLPPKKGGSKDVGGASGLALLCDGATAIKNGEKPADFTALQVGQHVLVTYGPVTSLVGPTVEPGKGDQVPSKTDSPPPSKTDQTPPPSKTEQTPPPSKTEPAPPSKTDQTPPPSKTGEVPSKGGSTIQFHALTIMIMPQEPLVPSKNGKQEPQQQIQQQAPVPKK